MDGDIIGPEDFSLTEDANTASGHSGAEHPPDLRTEIIGPQDVAPSKAELLTGPTAIDQGFVDLITQPGAKPCGCKP